MNITSLYFIIFIFVGLIIYYAIPHRAQWLWLIVLSTTFYVSAGKGAYFYIIFTTFTIWLTTKVFFLRDNNTLKKISLILTIILNLGILVAIKGVLFINSMFAIEWKLSNVIVPLGVSFYTLQAIGYLLDVYWGETEAEDNPLRLLLYLSFFPQVIQGPIARYNDLGKQLSEGHFFDIDNFEYGILQMIFGFFKKAVIADRLAESVNYVFDDITGHSAYVIFIGAILYAIQQYADFSGGIDIVSGAAKMYGITLAPNFKRPYFSHSLGEFWRRWHISLGSWMKDYVFYPFTMSKSTKKMTKLAKNKWGKQKGRVLPIVLGNILVFFLVGIWHGFYMHYIAWGLYNGFIIAFSSAMEPTYAKWKSKLKIKNDSKIYSVFQIIRTFLIVVLGGLFDRALSMADALCLWKRFFVGPHFGDGNKLEIICHPLSSINFSTEDILFIVIACLILFGKELYEELTGKSVLEELFRIKLIYRWLILLFFIFFVMVAHIDLGASAEFMYGNF